MKEEQRLFLVQATSAYAVFRLLNADKSLHHCHALHYLHRLFAVAEEYM